MEILGLVDVPAYVLVAAMVGILTYIHYRRNYSYFSRRGINGPTPLPMLGTGYQFFTKGIMRMDKEFISTYGSTVGLYEGSFPVLLTTDEDIIREVLVKNFQNFQNRRPLSSLKTDEMLGNLLTLLKDDDWKRVRSTLTPTFSSGKLKMMCKSVSDCADILVENLQQLVESGEDFDVKEVTGAFTLDVIARLGYGVALNSQKDKNDAFLVQSKKAINLKFTNPLLIIALFFPKFMPIAKKFGASFFDMEAVKFFSSFVESAMDERKAGDKTHTDFIQLMVNAHKDDFDASEVAKEVAEGGDVFEQNKTRIKALSKMEILAQGFIFFLAGYDTTSNGLTFLLSCLAMNPECQRKAQEEVDRVLGDKTEISYSDINELHYLTQCFNEATRLYPPAPRVDRVASNDITIKGIPIDKDTVVGISIYGRHMDPSIWPEPQKFDPDRFSPEERARHSPFDHMPFGYGPRNCIAMRMALMEVKLAAAMILKNFNLLMSPKTIVPLQFEKFRMNVKGGVWLKLENREH